MALKREPLLADQFLALPFHSSRLYNVVPRPYWEAARGNLLLAKRFVFTNAAAGYCAKLLKEAPRIVADAQDFAIPPFKRTYIELPFKLWYETLSGEPADPDADLRLGYLICGSEVTVIAQGEDGIGLSPIQYHLNQPWSLSQEQQFAEQLGISRIQFDLFYWGKSVEKLGTVRAGAEGHEVAFDEWQKEGLRALRASHSFSLRLPTARQTRLQEVWNKFSTSSAGELRNIIGLLLFLNRTQGLCHEQEEPAQQRMLRNKSVNLLAHRTITLHVDPLPRMIRSLVAGEGLRRRLHDVRGHYCHNKQAHLNAHLHDWVEDPGPKLLWTCECGARRWWRKEHERGDEAKGRVTADYRVLH